MKRGDKIQDFIFHVGYQISLSLVFDLVAELLLN